MKKLPGCLLILLLLMLQAVPAQAQEEPQTYTMIFRGTPIEQAIEQLVRETGIDLIYDPTILRNQQVYNMSEEAEPGEILSGILKGTNLDYLQLSSGTYVIIESAKAASRYGSLAGIVLDQESGKPLDGANVLLADASTGASTNQAGRFSIAPLLAGKYEVVITYVGYESVRDTVYIPSGSQNPRRFYLESRPVFVEPMVISGLQRRLPRQTDEGEEISLLNETLNSFAGSPDGIKSISPIMGVNFSLPLADFTVQGGATGEHQVLLDGVPVYNPVSLGRLMGAFSPYALEKVTIHKAGFGAPHGSQLSGIVSVQQDMANPEDATLVAQVDALNANLRLDATTSLGGNAEIQTMAAFRKNIWPLYQKPSMANALQQWDRLDPLIASSLLQDTGGSDFSPLLHNSEINYYDLHLKNRIRYNDFHSTTVSLYRGKNYLQTQLLSHNSNSQPGDGLPDLMYTQDTYDWLNNVGRLQHEWLVSARLDARFKLSYSGHRALHHYGMAGSDELAQVPADNREARRQLKQLVDGQAHTGDDNSIREYTVGMELDYSLLNDHQVRLGVESKTIDYGFQLSNPFYHSFSSAGRTTMLSGFLEDRISLSYRTQLTAGSRFTYVPANQKLFAEPRLSLRVDYPETKIGNLSLKLETGLYRQFINQFDITNPGPSSIVPSTRFWVPADYTTSVPKSYHLNSEFLLEPSETISLRLETFYKWYPSILAMDYRTIVETAPSGGGSAAGQKEFIDQGKSYAYGTGISADTFIESLSMDLSASYQYSVAEQRLPGRFEGSYTTTAWNEPHKLNASLDWRVFTSFIASLRWTSIWGRTWAFNRAYYDFLSIHDNQTRYGSNDFSNPSNDSLSPFHQLDLGLSYSLDAGASRIQFRLDLVNVLDRKNVIERQLIPRSSGASGATEYYEEVQRLPGFTPSIGIQLSY